MNFRLKMILGGIAAVIIPFLIAGILTYAQLTYSLEKIAQEKAEQVAVNLSGLLQTSLLREFDFAYTLASDGQIQLAVESGRYADIEKRLTDVFYLSGAGQASLFIADKNGIIQVDAVEKNRSGIHVSDRKYFLAAKAGRAHIGNPVESRANNNIIIPISCPIVTPQKGFVGAVVVAKNIDFIQTPLNDVPKGKTGRVFIINAGGVVITKSPDDLVPQINLTEEPGMESAVKSIKTKKSGGDTYIFRGKEKVMGFARIDVSGWHIVVDQDKEEIMAPANVILYRLVLACAILLLIAVASIILLSKKISDPVTKTLETLKQAMLNSSEIVAAITLNKTIEYVNPAMAKILGRTESELIGANPIFRSPQHIPEEEIWRSLETGKVWSGRLTFNEQASQPNTLDVMIVPVRNTRGAVIGYLEIGREISDQLIIEARLQQSQKMEAIGTLAGGIAHDFNNILASMMGYTELALRDPDPDKRVKYLNQVLSASQRAKNLVNQILAFSRKRDQQKIAVDMRLILKEAMTLLRATVPSSIEMNLDITREETMVLADPTQIHQIIMNLCTNAAYAMRESGGTLTIGLSILSIEGTYLSLYPDLSQGLYVHLLIRDTGPGIDPAIRQKIFDPFFTTKERGEGTGLGLSVVYGIVKSSLGMVTVESEIGQGATFHVYLPRFQGAVEESNEKKKNEAPRGTETILFVDDEETLVGMAKNFFEPLGYQVTGTTSSIEALRLFQEHPDSYDLVITDMTMPHMNGSELARAILKIRPNTPIILCTGYSDSINEETAREIRIRQFLMKPISLHDLGIRMRNILDNAGS